MLVLLLINGLRFFLDSNERAQIFFKNGFSTRIWKSNGSYRRDTQGKRLSSLINCLFVQIKAKMARVRLELTTKGL